MTTISDSVRRDIPEPTTAPAKMRTGPPVFAGQPIAHLAFADLRQRMALDGGKWDPQVGDVDVLAPFPLLMPRSEWQQLAGRAESLTTETLAAEQEILRRPKLLNRLGLPRPIARVLRKAATIRPTPAAGRIMRFDFHYSTSGWRISEVNSDVPGGFCEGSAFTEMMAAHFSLAPAGNPARAWTGVLADAAGPQGTVALLASHCYMEDQQITAFLARQLHALGVSAYLADPRQISWRDGSAYLSSPLHSGPVNVVLRFYPGDWLANRSRPPGWENYFIGGQTACANPGIALICESKRFPVVWDELKTPLPTWRQLLPESRDPRDCRWKNDDAWLLKGAFGDTGEGVCIRSQMTPKAWAAVARSVWWRPGNWVAQRQFADSTIPSPRGPVRACVGVYTVNGRAAGAYCRITDRPHIDFAAMDAGLLLTDA